VCGCRRWLSGFAWPPHLRTPGPDKPAPCRLSWRAWRPSLAPRAGATRTARSATCTPRAPAGPAAWRRLARRCRLPGPCSPRRIAESLGRVPRRAAALRAWPRAAARARAAPARLAASPAAALAPGLAARLRGCAAAMRRPRGRPSGAAAARVQALRSWTRCAGPASSLPALQRAQGRRPRRSRAPRGIRAQARQRRRRVPNAPHWRTRTMLRRRVRSQCQGRTAGLCGRARRRPRRPRPRRLSPRRRSCRSRRRRRRWRRARARPRGRAPRRAMRGTW